MIQIISFVWFYFDHRNLKNIFIRISLQKKKKKTKINKFYHYVSIVSRTFDHGSGYIALKIHPLFQDEFRFAVVKYLLNSD